MEEKSMFLKCRRYLTSAIMAITFIASLFMSSVSIYAYDYEDYELLEDKIRVDNKHDTSSHVNLYILGEEFLSGYFSYDFYQTDGQPYYDGAVTTPLIYHTRVENLKQVKTFSDGSYLYLITFGIENGIYVFSNNFCTDAITLTPDYKNPQKLNPVGTANGADYLSSYTEYFVDVFDETISVYCILGNDAWVDEHIDNLITYAKEHDNPTEYTNPNADTIDTSDVNELRQALKDSGYDSDLLEDFLNELEAEENQMQAETEESVEYTPIMNAVSELEDTQEKENPDVSITDEEPNRLNIVAWIITVLVLGLFIAGCIWQRKKREK